MSSSEFTHTDETGRQSASSTTEAKSQELADQIGSKIGEQKHTVARELIGVANALEVTASQLERQGQHTIADYASRAAKSFHRLGHRIEEKGTSELMRELEDLGREQPMLLAGGAAALGFALTRFFRSSGEEKGESHGDVH